ncbi:hypothetical protein WN51_06070 [Melipona quadrifasciata]|uniref:Uncharacterized protein n=1 Tax=Melipona quadrifasciata TaxID=166423 RepID=A0A0M8ZQY6_9HYME|nr:hypothetical protein WN51_06070 [Melipona quadrifasciata]
MNITIGVYRRSPRDRLLMFNERSSNLDRLRESANNGNDHVYLRKGNEDIGLSPFPLLTQMAACRQIELFIQNIRENLFRNANETVEAHRVGSAKVILLCTLYAPYITNINNTKSNYIKTSQNDVTGSSAHSGGEHRRVILEIGMNYSSSRKYYQTSEIASSSGNFYGKPSSPACGNVFF